MNLPNMLTLFRILLTPVFIILLFSNIPFAGIWALLVFIIASITDAYDGYYARKYDQVTDQGRFLDPLADKILISSAFLSFAVMGIVEYWMVVLIIFRDLFVTGLRMLMDRHGFTMLTSKIAKTKTVFQIGIIIFILAYMGIRGIPYDWFRFILSIIADYNLIYYLTLGVTLFTLLTGFTYIYDNRSAIRTYFAQN